MLLLWTYFCFLLIILCTVWVRDKKNLNNKPIDKLDARSGTAFNAHVRSFNEKNKNKNFFLLHWAFGSLEKAFRCTYVHTTLTLAKILLIFPLFPSYFWWFIYELKVHGLEQLLHKQRGKMGKVHIFSAACISVKTICFLQI